MKGFIPAKFTPIVFAFYMSGIMAFLMSAVLVAMNTGFGGDYFTRVIGAYLIAFPIAFVCVAILRPVVMKLVDLTIKKSWDQYNEIEACSDIGVLYIRLCSFT